MSGPHALETLRPCSRCSTSEMVQYIWSRVESCWDDVGGTGENTVSGGWDLLKVVEKKVLCGVVSSYTTQIQIHKLAAWLASAKPVNTKRGLHYSHI